MEAGGLRGALICFPVIFLGELPDKHHARRPAAGYLRATAAGVAWRGRRASPFTWSWPRPRLAAFAFLSHQAVDACVAADCSSSAPCLRLADGARGDQDRRCADPPRRGAVLTAFMVIFLAEWATWTQIHTANLAIKYHSPLSVGLPWLALGSVAAVAVTGGQALLRFISVATIRKVTAVLLAGLAVYTACSAAF